MPPVLITMPLTLLVSIPGWMYFSAFVHELSHLVTSRVMGFKIKEYRLWSAPWGVRGFVDVVIPGGTSRYFLKRGLMHLAGPVSHLVIIVVAAVCLIYSQGVILKTFWCAGIVVNCYLMIMNIVPAYSDGRQFLNMLKRKKGIEKFRK
ncbi:hypothetical protein [Phosphitispora fastidiosa]|uniref:hypothetical protein n=1 Tax=Phosphitispora fastidiosa TaxID=2837202 RepID=UPI001E4B43DB|nr:hypothetical protein [Phosphitispora fastidiosa]MBU7007034.1 Zn-dependent protease [Phosphitispora fastidiosa]